MNGNELKNPEEDPWPKMFKLIEVAGINYDFHIPSVGSAHLPNATKQLLSVTLVNESSESDVLDSIDKAINFRVEYQSIYENEVFIYEGDDIT